MLLNSLLKYTMDNKRNNFYDFCVYMDPDFFTPAKWHLKVIADAFQEIADGKIKCLAVSIAPRAGKSYITSLFCAWMLGRNPKGSIMRNSYAARLAEKFSKDIRDGIIQNTKFLEVFPNIKLSKNNQAVDGWSLDGNTQPSYFCAGVGGAITGFGAKTCVPGETEIITDKGIISIEKLYQEWQENSTQTLSYNHKNDKIRYNKIQAIRRKMSNEIIEFETESGRTIKCTPDHRVWNGKEYVEAGLLQQGDKLYRINLRLLSDSIQKGNVRTQEETENRSEVELLYKSLCGESLYTKEKDRKILQSVFQSNRKWQFKILLSRVQKCIFKKSLCYKTKNRNNSESTKTERYLLSNMQKRVSAKTFKNKILFKILCRCGTFAVDKWRNKSKFSWFKRKVKDKQKNCSTNKSKGQSSMCIMWFYKNAINTPFRRESKKQRRIQLNNIVPNVSHSTPQITCDTIRKIRRIYEPVLVYDIQVSKDNNFFADYFLVHNCSILDDPLKNIEEAMSELVIDNLWNWYTSTHLSRLEKGCPEIHIATRWSKKDPIGRLTDEYSETYRDDVKVICIPALDEHGNSFCEEIKSTEEYHNLRKITESFIWEAEFMQNPIESKGLLYPVEELKRFSMDDIKTKECDGKIGFTDVADKGSDYLCSLIGRKFGEYTYITDVVFTQEGVEITEPLVAQMIIDTECNIMKVESNAGGESFARNIRKLAKDGKSLCQVIAEPSTTNKETRIIMASGYVKEYFYFRKDYSAGSAYDKFMRQITSYIKMGKNKHDDGADALTGLGNFAKVFHFPSKAVPEKYDYFKDRLKPKNSNDLTIDDKWFNYGIG
jgi:predicted phage terminase large subunit-like protein